MSPRNIKGVCDKFGVILSSFFTVEKAGHDIIHGVKIPKSRLIHNISQIMNEFGDTVNEHIYPNMKKTTYRRETKLSFIFV